MPALHIPMYMMLLKDPIKAFLNYVNQQPLTQPLCAIHRDGELMLHAEKVTAIIHDVYPTDSPTVGMYVDTDQFSFDTNTLGKKKKAKTIKKRIINLAKKIGFALHHEHLNYDALVQNVVDKPFEANWYFTPQRFYEDGPPDNGLGTSAEKSCGENWPPQEFSRPLFARISLFNLFLSFLASAFITSLSSFSE